MLPFILDGDDKQLPFKNMDYLFFPDIKKAVEETPFILAQPVHTVRNMHRLIKDSILLIFNIQTAFL